MSRARCISLHAERLEDDAVWRRTAAFLARLERSDARATLFVHPRSAIAAKIDIARRIRELRDRGHEIGQHTHFYAEETDGGPPRTDLSAENVRRCLDRDHSYLAAAGAEPRGFVAGAWAMADAVAPWLRDHGFRYDATVRSFLLPYDSEAASAGDGWTVARNDDGIVRLPTTARVSEVVRGRTHPARAGWTEYDLLYLHDYDLLRVRSRVAATIASSGRHRWTLAEELASLAATGSAER